MQFVLDGCRLKSVALQQLSIFHPKVWRMIRWTAVLIFAGCLQVSARTYSQKVTIKAANQQLIRVLKDIGRQSGYYFIYQQRWLKDAHPVNINIKDMPLEAALAVCLKGQPLTYTFVEKTIVLAPKKDGDSSGFAIDEKQLPLQWEIHGRVTDSAGNPVVGVSIVVVNTKHGTVTNGNGEYRLSASSGDVLQFGYVGYKTKLITVGRNEEINVKLLAETSMLNDIVMIGYGTSRSGDVTGAISSYKPKENEAATSLSVDQMLQGKVPGMQVTNSFSGPGAASSVIIRGANSLRGDNQPLYIIDNVPQPSTGQFEGNENGDNQIPENPLTTLNPSDIESIQVLKDASATAIYGSRGANGVIIITTKKGIAGKTKINLNSNVTDASAVRLPKMMNLEAYGQFLYDRSGVQSFYPVNGQMRYVFSGITYDPNNDSTYHIVNYQDWQKETYRHAISQNYDLSVSGGGGKTTYFLSANYKNIQGLVKSTAMQIGNFRLNVNSDLSKRLKLSVMLSGGLRKSNMMNGGDTRGSATGAIVSAAMYGAPFIYPAGDPILNSSLDARTTSLSWITDYNDITNEKTFRASTQLDWKISNVFSYSFRAGGDITIQDRARWYGLQLFQGYNNNGYLSTSEFNKNNSTIENLFNFNKQLGDIVNITGLAGVTYDKYASLNDIVVGTQFQNFILTTNGISQAGQTTIYQPDQKDYQLLSYLGRVNLSFLHDRYIATVNFRADGTSKFQPANRWGYFPSLALAWRMENENFIQNLKWINQLKLRLGYGKTGSQSINPYQTLSFYTSGTASYYADNSGTRLLAINTNGMTNSDLKWETTSSYDAGLDFAVLDSRISGTVDAYYKETNNLLILKNIPVSTGYTSVYVNQGSLSNNGLELSLNGNVIRNKNVVFSLGGNIAFNNPKVIKLGLPEGTFGNHQYVAYLGNTLGDHYGAGNIFIQGKAPGLFWGYKTDGIYQMGDNIGIKQNLSGSVPVPGDIKYVDENGDSIINSNDQQIIGNPNPKFIYGFNASIKYKSFTLSAYFNGVYGNQILNANLRDAATPSLQSPSLRESVFKQMWTSTYASKTYSSATYNLPNVVMDRYIEDGSFLRLSSVMLSYTLPQNLVSRLGMEKINVYASGQNLLLLTKYSGFDPEVNTFAFDGLRPGIDLYSYPNARSLVLGLNITF